MRQTLAIALFAVAIVPAGTPSLAQTQEQLVEAFSGQWFVFEPTQWTGDDTCLVTLNTTALAPSNRMTATTANCAAPLSATASWSVEGGVLQLFDTSDVQLAELGGNQRRITGVSLPDQTGLVVERSNGDGNAEAIAMSVQKHRCYYVGLSSTCAGPDELAAPIFTAEGDRELAEIETFGNVMVRSQPRRDATRIGTIPTETCIRVNQCLIASDGTWCRATFGETQGWIAKTALRQNEWPVVTYKAACTAAAE